MSPPDYFDIEYSINPWMNTDNRVDHKHAEAEWHRLRETYTDLGLPVELIPPEPGLPDLVFTTDHGKLIDGTWFASSFRFPERNKEQLVVLPWYRAHDIEPVILPAGHFMEGGDIFSHNGRIFVGYGFRTSENTAEFLHEQTGRETVALRLVDESFYHLDTCFFPVDADTAFYYPPAFTPGGEKDLMRAFPILIALTREEAERFVCNSVVVGKQILCQSCPTFENSVLDLGYTPLVLGMVEFNKSGGGIHCLSQILE